MLILLPDMLEKAMAPPKTVSPIGCSLFLDVCTRDSTIHKSLNYFFCCCCCVAELVRGKSCVLCCLKLADIFHFAFTFTFSFILIKYKSVMINFIQFAV